MTFRHLEYLMDSNIYKPEMAEQSIDAVRMAFSTKSPILLDGPPGSGKTMATYYVAKEIGAEVIEYNASDELRSSTIQDTLRSEVEEIHGGKRIILLDELDKNSKLKFLTKMIKLNKETAFETNTVIVATTNYGWQLGKKKFTFGKGSDKVTKSILDEFSANHIQVKSPHKGKMKKWVKRLLGTKKLLKREEVPKDLRYLEKVAVQNFQRYIPEDLKVSSKSSFDIVGEFLSANISERTNKLPSARETAGSLEKWILANLLDDKNPIGIVNKNQTELMHSLEILSLSAYYNDRELLKFLPSFFVHKFKYSLNHGSVRHPNTILKQTDDID